MRESYPAKVWTRDIAPLEPEEFKLVFNIAYLHEHGLLSTEIRFTSDGTNRPIWAHAALTAAGVDFLEDDGGLSAILGVVNVRLHADTVRELLAARIAEDPSLTEETKSALREAIKKQPETALSEITTRLVQAGLAHLPDAIQILQTWLRL